MLHCCVRLSSVTCIVAKRCVLEQQLLFVVYFATQAEHNTIQIQIQNKKLVKTTK